MEEKQRNACYKKESSVQNKYKKVAFGEQK